MHGTVDSNEAVGLHDGFVSTSGYCCYQGQLGSTRVSFGRLGPPYISTYQH